MSPPSEWAMDAAHAMLSREGLDPDIQRGVRDRLQLAISTALDAAHAAGLRTGIEAAAKVCIASECDDAATCHLDSIVARVRGLAQPEPK